MSCIKLLSKLGCNSCTCPVYSCTMTVHSFVADQSTLVKSINKWLYITNWKKRCCGIKAVILISYHLAYFSRQRANNHLLYLNKLINDLSMLEWLSLKLCRLSSFCTITNLKIRQDDYRHDRCLNIYDVYIMWLTYLWRLKI